MNPPTPWRGTPRSRHPALVGPLRDAGSLLDRFRGLIERSDDVWAKTSLRLVELTEVSRRVASADGAHEAVSIVSGFLLESLRCNWLYVGLMDRQRGLVAGTLTRRHVEERTRLDIPLDDPSSVLIWAIQSRESVGGGRASDLWGSHELEPGLQELGSYIAHPLRGGLGVVVVDAEGHQRPSADETLALDLFLAHLGGAVETALLYRRLNREQRFRASVTDSISSGLITIDRRGKVTGINAVALELLGVDSRRVLDQPIQRLWRAEGRRVNPLLEALSKGREVSQKAVRLRRLDGSTIEVDVKVSILRVESGPYSGVVAELRDVSSIRRMEDEIFHLEKLAALGRLTTSVAHEIRNPLAGIVTGVQYLARSIDEEDPRRESIHYILNEIMRLDRIIVDLYSVSRPTTLCCEEIHPPEVVERALRSLVDLSTRHEVKIDVESETDLPHVYIDADKIQQVLINLIKNAIEVSAKGDTITIRLEAANRFASTADTRDQESSHVLISVEDHGPGIADEDLERLFEPFFSRKQGGTGLGLYVSHAIVERHGGDIQVHTVPEKGTRMTLEIPLDAFALEEAP